MIAPGLRREAPARLDPVAERGLGADERTVGGGRACVVRRPAPRHQPSHRGAQPPAQPFGGSGPAAFSAAETCATRWPWKRATSRSSAVGFAPCWPETEEAPYGVPARNTTGST